MRRVPSGVSRNTSARANGWPSADVTCPLMTPVPWLLEDERGPLRVSCAQDELAQSVAHTRSSDESLTSGFSEGPARKETSDQRGSRRHCTESVADYAAPARADSFSTVFQFPAVPDVTSLIMRPPCTSMPTRRSRRPKTTKLCWRLDKFPPPLSSLIELAPILIHPDDAFTGVRQRGAIRNRDHRLSLHHAVISGNQQRLGLHELPLTGETRAEQTLTVVSRPGVG